MRAELPAGLAFRRRTPVFDETTVPAALRREHRTKAGVWGLIRVIEGRLLYRILDPPGETMLDPATPGVVEPARPHEVVPQGRVRFRVEFYDAKPTGRGPGRAHGTAGQAITAPLRIKRVYEPPEPEDGARVLVDRLWPRGLSKEQAAVALWLKEAAPSDSLRRWFGHRPERWPEFRQRYAAELKAKPEALAPLRQLIAEGPATLVFAARDPGRNNAVALAEYLDRTDHELGLDSLTPDADSAPATEAKRR